MKREVDLPSPVGKNCFRCAAAHGSESAKGGKVILHLATNGKIPKWICFSCGAERMRVLAAGPVLDNGAKPPAGETREEARDRKDKKTGFKKFPGIKFA